MKKSDAHIVENIRKYIPLTVEEAALFLNFFKPHKVKKNEIFTQQGSLYSPFILIKSSCLMTYFTDGKGPTHVIQFGIDMWWTGDLNAFLNQHPSQYSIKAMLDSELLILDLEASDIGFFIDESADQLGHHLLLPPHMLDRRDEIIAPLEPIKVPAYIA